MIKHTTPYTKPNNPIYEISKNAWNEDHSIDDGTISIIKLSDHNKASHDALGINADTVDGLHASEMEQVASLPSVEMGKIVLLLIDGHVYVGV